MFKKSTASLLALLLMLVFALPAMAEEADLRPVAVEVDGQKLAVEAYMVEGRTMVPLRAIFERLSATLEWNAEERSITAVRGTTTVKLAIDKTEANIDGKEVILDVPPLLIHGSTYVPLRFVSEALGAQVDFDGETFTALVSTGSSCSTPGGQVHSGEIRASGETWGLCGSPHIVQGDFYVEGSESPVLAIEAGAVVRFESGAAIRVGENAPGGLIITGTSDKPAVLTAATAGAEPGFWSGIRFGEQTIRGKAEIEHARIEYAGGYEGAVHALSFGPLVEVTLKDTLISKSSYTGLQLTGNTKLSSRSSNMTITGTKVSQAGGGFPMIVDMLASHNIPNGQYTGNDADAIRLSTDGTSSEIKDHTTWRNLGIPYDSDIDVYIQGPANPVLTIEPGVVTRWSKGRQLVIAESDRGGLQAVGTKEKPIAFTSDLERPGAWGGIYIGSQATNKNTKLQFAVIEYAETGLNLYEDIGAVISDSIIRNNQEYGIFNGSYDEGVDYRQGYNNTFEDNGSDQNVGE